MAVADKISEAVGEENILRVPPWRVDPVALIPKPKAAHAPAAVESEHEHQHTKDDKVSETSGSVSGSQAESSHESPNTTDGESEEHHRHSEENQDELTADAHTAKLNWKDGVRWADDKHNKTGPPKPEQRTEPQKKEHCQSSLVEPDANGWDTISKRRKHREKTERPKQKQTDVPIEDFGNLVIGKKRKENLRGRRRV